MSKQRPKWKRWLLRGAYACATLVFVLLASLVLLTSSDVGRGALLSKLLPLVNQNIPGRIEVERISRLDTSGVGLRGLRVLDPTDKEVARLQQLDVEIELRELLDDRIIVPRLSLSTGWVDLRQLDEPREGLIAAFVDPDAPASPPSAAPPPYVAVRSIELEGIDLSAPELQPIGALEVRALALDGQFELDGLPHAELTQLSLRLERGAQPVGQINEMSATYNSGADPSQVALTLELFGMQLALDAQLVLPPEPSWQQAPLSASLELAGVSSAALAQLLQNPELEETFQGDVNLTARAEGSIQSLNVDAVVDSAAGKLDLSALIEDEQRAEVALATESFRADKLLKGAPAYDATLQLTASANAADPERIPVTLTLKDSALDQTALPELSFTGEVTPKRLEQIVLEVNDGPSQVKLTGHVGIDAATAPDARVQLNIDGKNETLQKWARFSGQQLHAKAHLRANLDVALTPDENIDVRGTLSGRDLRFPDAQIARVDAKLALSGKPQRPSGQIDLRVRRAKVADQEVHALRLTVDGGPRRYRVQLDGEAPNLTAKADLRVAPSDNRVRLEGHASGTLALRELSSTKQTQRSWMVDIEPTVVGFDGGVSTDGLLVALGKQQLRVKGRVHEREAALEFSSNQIALDELSALLELDEPLRGKAELAGRLDGSLQQPNVELRLVGDHLTLGERPPIELTLDTKLDTNDGTLAFQLALAASETSPEEQPLKLDVGVVHQFDGGAGWQDALPEGTATVQLDVERIDSRFVAAWAKLQDLPAHGVVSGSVSARGSRERPELSARLQAATSALGANFDVETALTLKDGRLRVASTIDDARGRWIDLDLGLDFNPDAIEAQLGELPRALSDRPWALDLTVEDRELSEIPGATLTELEGMSLGAKVVLAHEPGQEPEGRILVSAHQTGPIAAAEGMDCAFVRSRVELDASLEGGKVRGLLTAKAGSQPLLDSQISLPLQLMPAVRGEGLALGPITASLEARRLQLESLPLLCGVVQGTFSGRVAAQDPLGRQPLVDGEFSIGSFSFGGRQTVDVETKLKLDHQSARLNANVRAAGKTSTLSARLPIDLSEGRLTVAKNAEVAASVVLDDLPISPFLNPSGAVSYASGTLDGKVDARGPIDQPRVQGHIDLQDVAFTATSLAQPLRGVRGRLSFSNTELSIERFEARDREGVLKLNGQAKFADPERIEAKLDVRADEFPVRQQGQVVATVDVGAKIAALRQPERTQVTVNLENMDMWLESLEFRSGIALTQHPDFVIDGVTAPDPNVSATATTETAGTDSDVAETQTSSGKKSAPASSDPTSVAAASPQDSASQDMTRLTLAASDGIWVKRSDFAVNVYTKLTTEITDDASRVTGKVNVRRGYAQIMGKVFDVEKGGYLEFVGTKRPDPVVNLTVTHDNRRSGQRISLTITGRSSAPELTFRVDSQVVTAGKAFEALYGSQRTNQSPNAAQDQAKGFVGGLTAGLMATTTRRELGAAAPIIMIEPGEHSGEGRVRAGFDFDFLVPGFLQDVVTGVYFEGIADKNSEGAAQGQSDGRVHAAALLELYFPKNFFTAGQYGPGSTWSADIGWQL